MTEIERLRKVLEDHNYKMDLFDYEDLRVNHFQLATKHFGSSIWDYQGVFYFLDGTLALNSFNRIVNGAHGPYVEFDEKEANFEMYIPPREAWRTKPSPKVKYLHKQPTGRLEKVYYQLKDVSYADYKPGKCYIDLYLLKL